MTDEIYNSLCEETYASILSIKFLHRITNPTTQNVIHGQLEDEYTYEVVREVFISATRGQREADEQ